MLARFQLEWVYNNVASNALNGMLEDKLVSAARADEIKDLLSDRERVAASLASVESGRIENVAMALAVDCALQYQLAANDSNRDDFLKIAARAMMLEEMPEPFIRVSVSALLDESRRLSWETPPQQKAC